MRLAAASLDASKLPRRGAEADRPPRLVNCRSSSRWICFQRRLETAIDTVCSCATESAIVFLQQLGPRPAPLALAELLSAVTRFHRQGPIAASPDSAYRALLAGQPRPAAAEQIEPASPSSPPAAAPARSRLHGAGLLFKLRESLPARPQLAGECVASGLLAGGQLLEGSAMELGSFIGWRVLGVVCLQRDSWGGGQAASGSPRG